jgi:hypothetical protein
MVRKHYQQQQRFDNSPIVGVSLNLEYRDEIVPFLFGLQHLYSDSTLRRKAVQLIAADNYINDLRNKLEGDGHEKASR